MASVWKRLQRVNKRAAKFQYTASYHRIDLHTSTKWKPNKLSVVWTRRSRRVVTDPLDWEPSLKDPLQGCVIWAVPENQTVSITLFKDSRTNELEDKDWTFVLEDVSPAGKRRRLASSPLNMRRYASLEPTQHNVTLTLHPTTHKIQSASVHLTIHCVLLREGRATDEDMQSLASLLSVNNNSDIAPLEDLDEDDYSLSDNSASIKQMLDLTHRLDQMTTSLTVEDLATPLSVQSLNLDRTPTAPVTPLTAFSPDAGGDDDDDYDRQKTPTADLRMHDTPSERLKTVETKVMEAQKPNELKGFVFKTQQFSKHNLKPLELKSNLNSLQESGDAHTDDATPLAPSERHRDADKTPVQDLLEWCKEATQEYRQCRVTNLTTSFRNGIAFCAIIHRYRPDLIDFSALQPEDAETNVRVALEASAKLGVSQVLTARDVLRPGAPDRLAVMTHLFQLRAHFTGGELQVEQLALLAATLSDRSDASNRSSCSWSRRRPPATSSANILTSGSYSGNNPQESSYMVGRHDTDSEMPAALFSLEIANRKTEPPHRNRLSSQDSVDSQSSQDRQEKASSPTSNKDVRGLLLAQSKNILGKMLSPTKEKLAAQKDARLIKEVEKERSNTRWFGDPLGAANPNNEVRTVKPVKLMTHKQLVDPFGSDEEDEEINTLETSTPTSEWKPSEPASETPAPVLAPRRDSRSLSPPPAAPDLPKPPPQLLTRHDELKERARQLLEATKREARDKDGRRERGEKEERRGGEQVTVNGVSNGDASPKKMSEEARQAALRERARRLIADARAGVVSPTSPTSPARLARAPTVEIISRQSMMDEIAAAGGVEQLDNLLSRQSSAESRHSANLQPNDGGVDNGNDSTQTSPARLHSFSQLIERLTPDKDAENDDLEGEETGSYIQSEMEALEREQSAIDEQAALLEKELRRVMETSNSNEMLQRKLSMLLLSCFGVPHPPHSPLEEDKLMSKWFTLVNKKNALLRRQMQLNILEQEEDLSRRCNLLARELRLSLAVEEWRKTPGQRRRERLLLQELLAAVNERDRLVQEMDSQEKAIADDDEIERNLSHVEIQRKNNCILQ